MPPFNSPPWSGSSAAAELNAEVTRETLYDHRRRCVCACRVAAIAARRVGVGSHGEWQHHSVLGECHRLRSCGYACIHALARNAHIGGPLAAAPTIFPPSRPERDGERRGSARFGAIFTRGPVLVEPNSSLLPNQRQRFSETACSGRGEGI